MYVDLSQANVFLLVLLRMTGIFITNPVLGRRNIPSMLKVGLAFVLTVLLTSSMDFSLPAEDPSFGAFLFMGVKELIIGMIASFMIQIFLSVLVIGGEAMDMQIGIGMAKVFDPGSNASISLSSTLLNSMFILVFFATNNHLTLIKLASQTFTVIPLGAYAFNWDIAGYMPQFFSTIFIFAIKMAMPVIVVEIIITLAVGIIMRIIPAINVFILNIHFKLTAGIFVLIVLVGPFMGFLENIIVICFEQISYIWSNFTLPVP